MRVVLTCLVLVEATSFADVITEVTARHEVDDEVEVLSVLECIVHVH